MDENDNLNARNWDPLKLAVELAEEGYKDAMNVFFTASGYTQFEKLFAFTPEENTQLGSLRDSILRYVKQQTPPRPLCLAIFGPPGSGKSFAVKQIRNAVKNDIGFNEAKLDLPYTVVNLTQISQPDELGRVLARIAGEQDEKCVPIIFIDEFDAASENTPFGWLSWFLAPMYDGEFLHQGATIRLRRAVYVFAGGTAYTMKEFALLSTNPGFRSAKGPDFVSRLQGFLDVKGPNSHPKLLRRALVIHDELKKQTERNKKPITTDQALLESLLTVGRYRHGARSITAVIESSSIESTFSWCQLPKDHLLQLHVDRGPLDERRIKGSVALSGYPAWISTQTEDALPNAIVNISANIESCWKEIAKALWDYGASLSFAGGWKSDSGEALIRLLAKELVQLKEEPSSDEKTRRNPSPWLYSFINDDDEGVAFEHAEKVDAKPDSNLQGLKVIGVNYLTAEEERILNAWQSRVVERFRRRLHVSETSLARFAIGGVTTPQEHKGRMPGIAEEIMLTLAMRKPVYLAGGFGGATADVGSLLGFAHPRTGEVPQSLRELDDGFKKDLELVAEKLRPSPWPNLPVSPPEAADFFKSHSFGTSDWPDNGLSAEENRQLFNSTDSNEMIQLVTSGLVRLFDH